MRRFFLLAAAAIAFAGCVKTEIDEVDGTDNSGDALAYDPAKIVTIITEDGETRGTPIGDVSAMTDMGAFCSYTGQADWTTSDVPAKMTNEKLVRNATTGAWEYTGTPVEWNPTLASDRYTFFAYAPYATGVYDGSTNPTGNGIVVTSTAATPGVPTLRYTVPAGSSAATVVQPDLMVAVPQKDLRHVGNPVRMQMEHALTCIGFEVAGEDLKVAGISFSGISMTGELALDGGNIAWTALDDPEDNTAVDFSALLNYDDDPDNPGQKLGYFTASASMSSGLVTDNGYLMMIPQTLGSDALLTVTLADGVQRKIPLDANTWAPGARVVYNISLLPAVDPDDITGGGNVEMVTYVGAFWRADQRGERLVRMTLPDNVGTDIYSGNWAVQVLDRGAGFADGDILFQSWDGTLPNSSKEPDTDALTAGSVSLTGTSTDDGEILFRIGIDKTWSSQSGYTAQKVRYARVVVSFGTKNGKKFGHNRVIYIRQGHEPDYVMAPGDPGMTDAPTRPDARKWSPYNLTAKTWPASDTEFVQIKKRNADGYVDGTGTSEADFAKYPTQAGAFFQWAQKEDNTTWHRRALNPGLPTYSDWNSDSYADWTWDYELYETCPEGYRRPDIKEQGDGIAGNEAWQSFAGTQGDVSANSVWGYYADGYFDRREMQMAEGTSANTTNASVVAKGGKDAAYIGRIIFNNSPSSTSHYNASLFVPAAGYRIYSSGAPYNAGSNGYGWSRHVSSSNSKNGCGYNVSSADFNPYNSHNKSHGMSVRCVVDPDPPYIPTVDPEEITGAGNVTNIRTYVGAFWKAGHKGERFISIPIGDVADNAYAGDWAVQVLDMGAGFADGDILFQQWNGKLPTTHPANADIDTTPLTAGATTLMGSVANGGEIAFRIGLRTPYDAANGYSAARPVRYARVVVSFGKKDGDKYGHNRVIYIRQGHEPDNMFPERPLAKAFSPYNLTAAAYRTDGGASNTVSYNVGYQGGVMTEYPSQAGAFFQWAHTNGAYAFHPTLPNDATTPNGFGTSNTVTTWWDDGLESIYETCPDGYRRPTDGLTNDHHNTTTPSVSEMAQSLWIEPQNNNTNPPTADRNFVWGYYADGFFDRREITDQTAYSDPGTGGTAVATNTSTVAYVGQLFYNKFNNASLFFPAPGYRHDSNGYLHHTGSYGFYWSSSSFSTAYSWLLYMYSGNASRSYYFRGLGFSVRCVVE